MSLLLSTLRLSSAHSLKRMLPLLLVLLFSSPAVFAVEKVWTGATSTSWNTASNWSPSGVPGNGDDVIIGPISQGNFHPAKTGTLTIGNWNTGSLLVKDDAVLTVTGEIIVTGGSGVDGIILSNGGVLNHTGTDFTLPYVSTVCIAINGGKLITNAEDFLLTGKMTMSSGEFIANDGFAVAGGKEFKATGGTIRVTGHLDIKSSGSSFYAGSDSLIVTGRVTLSSSCNFFGGSAKIVVNRTTNASNTNNQISGNWFTENATVTFNPYLPLGGRLTSISSSGASFHVNQGTVYFADSVYIGSNASLDGDSGEVTFTKSLVVSGSGTVNNDVGVMNFQGNATFTSSGTFNTGSGQINVGGDVAFSSNGVINNTSASINITGDAVFQNSGTLNAGSGEITVGGSVTFEGNGGTINAGTSTISVGGDFNNLGTFNCDSSMVILSGANSQIISSDVTFFNLAIQTQGTLEANGNITVLNNGTIGTNTEISIPDNNNQFEVNGDLVDSSGSLSVATNKPFVTGILVNTATEIVVVFNETVTQASVQNAANSTWTGRTISSRVLIDSNKLRIVFTPAISFNTEYTLVFQNIQNTRNPVGTMSPNHEKRFTWVLPDAPSTSASNMTFTTVTKDSMTVRWTNGNGARRVVLMRRDSAVSFNPVNGTDYAANATYGSGTNLGNGQYTVYQGTGDSIRVKGLTAGITYYFRVIEYNGTGLTSVYRNTTPLSGSRIAPYAGPSTAATNMTFTTVSKDSMTVRWTNGNGAKRIVLMRRDSAVSFAPVNGTEYTANSTYAGGTNLGNGQYTVYQGTGDSIRVKGLTAGVTYYFRVVEYNGTAANTVYQTVTPLSGSRLAPFSAPSTAATNMTFTTVTSDSMTVRWTNGNGSKRVVFIRPSSAVTFSAANGTEYTANSTYGSGTNLGSSQYAVYQGTGDSIRVKGLTPGLTYHFRVVEYNGTSANTVYQTVTPLSGSRLAPFSAPSTAATSMTFTTVTSDSMTVRWTNGNGSKRVVFIRSSSAVTFSAANGTEYTANSTYGSGTNLGSNQYAIYQGTGDSMRVKGLTAGVTYHFRVVEYNGTAANTVYQTITPLSGSRIAPFAAPSTAATNMTFTTVSKDSMTVRWTNGNGARRIVLMRRDSAVSFAPVNGTEYTANSTYGSGTNLGNGQYTVYQGTGDSIRVKGLSEGVTYYFRVVEYNGTVANTVYQTIAPLSGSRTAPFTAPTTAATNMTFTTVTKDSLTVRWTNGNGTKRIVLMRRDSAVSFAPVNGTEYAANSTYGTGDNLGNGQYTVYQGTGDSIRVKGLTPGVTYYFRVLEYKGTTSNTVYQTVSPLSGSRTSSFSAPTVQTSSFITSVTSDTTIGLSWTAGNGSFRIVVARESSAVSGTPSNNTGYTANSTFGLGTEIGNGNYVVYAGTGTNVTVTGLDDNKTYHFAIMEFNGSGQSQTYLTTSAPTIGKNTNVRVDIKIFLEGPFNGTDMTPAINSVIPDSQVYNASPWNYNGTETVNGMPVNNVVDWVLVELREASSVNQAGQGALVGRRAGLLLSNGKIVDLDGVSPLLISTSRSGKMYVVVYHRTHVAIQSNDSLLRSNKKHVYDFTASATSAHGTTPLKEVSTGIYAMYCGRYAGSTSLNITLTDFVNAWNERNAIGYYPGDVNMDGVVDAFDRSQIWNNRGTVSRIRE